MELIDGILKQDVSDKKSKSGFLAAITRVRGLTPPGSPLLSETSNKQNELATASRNVLRAASHSPAGQQFCETPREPTQPVVGADRV